MSYRSCALLFQSLGVLSLSGCYQYGGMSGETIYLGGTGPTSSTASVQSMRPTILRDSVSYWDGDGVPGSPAITIHIPDQKAYFYKGGDLVGVSLISTGREGYNTPSGNFKVTEKDVDHRSNLYGAFVDSTGSVVVEDVAVRKDRPPPGTRFEGAPMFYFMRVHGAVGMHAGYLPGYAASHGCIRLPEHMAQKFYENAPQGTPVKVVAH